MKICTIVGARPQFIKAAALSRILRKKHSEVLIHTGQHFDFNMSGVFFEELEIPEPDYNLGISGGYHGKMTGEMLIEIEKVLIKEKPDMLIVYGDTNSTLAGALAGVKLQIPVCHVEAGNRLGALSNPEEVNRVLTDRISSILFCCVESSVDFLNKEGLTENVYLVGDPMLDAFCFYRDKLPEHMANIEMLDFDGKRLEIPNNYYYLTCHRPENEKETQLFEILSAMNCLEYKTVYPVHPRNREIVKKICMKNKFENIILAMPVSYLTSIYLTANCYKVVTDSGGLQREAFFAGKQCVTVFDYVGWPETMTGNCNQLAKPYKDDILSKLDVEPVWNKNYHPFGDGKSCKKMVDIIDKIEVKNG